MLFRSSLVDELTGQVAVLGITLHQALPFKIAADALCDALRQLAELGARGRLHPAQTNCAGGVALRAAISQIVGLTDNARDGRALGEERETGNATLQDLTLAPCFGKVASVRAGGARSAARELAARTSSLVLQPTQGCPRYTVVTYSIGPGSMPATFVLTACALSYA